MQAEFICALLEKIRQIDPVIILDVIDHHPPITLRLRIVGHLPALVAVAGQAAEHQRGIAICHFLSARAGGQHDDAGAFVDLRRRQCDIGVQMTDHG